MIEQEPKQGKSQEELEAEIERLKNELKNRDEEVKRWYQFHYWAGKKIGSVFLGWQLKDSIHRLFDELKQGKVTQQTLADVSAHTLWRFTRIGLFAILAAVIPVLFIAVQTFLLFIQNKKIENQNQRIIQQTYLQEAERRSSQVFLYSNIQDKIDEELKAPINTKRELSEQTIWRIIALSHALKPYRYLDGDTLIRYPASPERGQLLLSLANSELDSNTLQEISVFGNFNGAEMDHSSLKSVNIKNIKLKRAVLTNSTLVNVKLRKADLFKSDLRHSSLFFSDLSDAFLAQANLKATDFSFSDLIGASLIYANLTDANFTNANLTNANLFAADLTNANLTNADLTNANLANADLTNADLTNADLKQTKLDGAIISNPKQKLGFKPILKFHPYIKKRYKISEEQKNGALVYVLRMK